MITSSHFQLGYVAKAHGLRGEVVVRTFDPASEALFEVERVFVRRKDGTEQELRVEAARTAGKDLLVTFEEIPAREEAERLVGSTVFVLRDDLPPPEEGEFFQGDLIGLEAVDETHTVVGRVEEIWNTGEVPTLVIRAPGKEELLLPFVDEFVGEVDLEKRRVVVKPYEATE